MLGGRDVGAVGEVADAAALVGVRSAVLHDRLALHSSGLAEDRQAEVEARSWTGYTVLFGDLAGSVVRSLICASMRATRQVTCYNWPDYMTVALVQQRVSGGMQFRKVPNSVVYNPAAYMENAAVVLICCCCCCCILHSDSVIPSADTLVRMKECAAARSALLMAVVVNSQHHACSFAPLSFAGDLVLRRPVCELPKPESFQCAGAALRLRISDLQQMM